jgi:streptogramin lyase
MPAGLYPDWAQGLAFDSHGRLWTGAEIVQSGIVVGGSFVEFDLATHRFRRHDFPTTQSWPNAIAFSRDGSLWATTLGVPDIVELVR